MTRLRLVALGTGVALAMALPAALLAQVLEALRDNGDGTVVTYVLAVVVLAAMALGGTAVGRHRPERPAVLGTAVGLLAIAAVLAIGIARRVVAGEEVAWTTVPALAVLAMALAAVGSTLSAQRTGRKRS